MSDFLLTSGQAVLYIEAQKPAPAVRRIKRAPASAVSREKLRYRYALSAIFIFRVITATAVHSCTFLSLLGLILSLL